jgi:hypothetical protein
MRRGDFTSAWQIADRVLAERVTAGPCWHLPRHEQWVWDGRPLADQTVLVRCYHGLGDTLQFARFLPRLQTLARDVIVWAQPGLVPLLQTLACRRPLRVLPLHDGAPEVDYDVDLEIMELGHALRVVPETLSADVPYFHVQPEARLSDRLSVGVVARGGDWDQRRDVPGDLLASLVDRTRDTAWFSLQLGPPVPGMRDARLQSVLQLAARVRALDLVITVDTMMAHLAGALGVPTWTLLPREADWRWMDESRSDSPWYPTMRLFRQPRAGDWMSVIDAVGTRLQCGR